MKTGSDLTELRAFRNHTSHKHLCLNSDCILCGRKATNAHVVDSVQSSVLHTDRDTQREGVLQWCSRSVQRMGWLRTGSGVSTCREDVHSTNHCLTQDRFVFWLDLNVGG